MFTNNDTTKTNWQFIPPDFKGDFCKKKRLLQIVVLVFNFLGSNILF